MLNKIMLPADADAQRARLTSAGAACTGHLAETGSAGAGLVVRIRPWLVSVPSKSTGPSKTTGVTPGRYAASISFTQARTVLTQARNLSDLSAQPSTAAASGLCASKKYQEKARRAAAIGGALGPLPPRDPV
jgi:hypothetical protein